MRGLLLVLALWLIAGPARAADPVIEPGREREVLALFAPHQLGHQVVSGWKLWNVTIGAREIVVELSGPAGAAAQVRLTPLEGVGERTASFSVGRDATARTPEARPAADAVIEAVRRNDAGTFWRSPPRPEPRLASSTGSRRGLGWPIGTALATLLALLVVARATSRSERAPRSPS